MLTVTTTDLGQAVPRRANLTNSSSQPQTITACVHIYVKVSTAQSGQMYTTSGGGGGSLHQEPLTGLKLT